MPDVLVRTGRYAWMPPMPAIPGIEVTGEVCELGAGVDPEWLGLKVWVSARDLPFRGNGYAQYLVAPTAALNPLPAQVDLKLACCLSNHQVAWHLLHSAPRGTWYQSVLVWAAAGGVGSAVVDIARHLGKQVIGLTTDEHKQEMVRRMGAQAVLDHRQPQSDLLQAIRSITGGAGVDLVLDPVGGPQFERNIDFLAPLGMVINYGLLQGHPGPGYADALKARFGDSLAFRYFSMHTFDERPDVRKHVTRILLDCLAKEQIRPHVHDVLPLAQAALAHEWLESGQVCGKLLLNPWA
jgi:NADPH2:quinone reductase